MMHAGPHASRLAQAGAWLESCATSQEDFAGAFDEAARILGARAFYMARLGAGGSLGFYAGASARDAIADYRTHGWHARDVWSAHAARAARDDCSVVTDRGLVRPAERRGAAFFQEYCRQWDLGHFAAWRMNIEGEDWVGTLIRLPGDEFATGDETALAAFAQSARRAALLACRFRDARIAGLAEGLEHSGRPSLVLNRNGRVAFATSGALAYADRAFRIRQGLLAGLTADADRHLMSFARSVVDGGASAPPPFAIASPLLARPLVGVPMYLGEAAQADLPGAAAILMLVDPAHQTGPAHAVVRTAFDLTQREAELACLLGAGRTISEAAVEMGLRLSSARQVAKLVLAKAGVRRQAELAILLQRLVTR